MPLSINTDPTEEEPLTPNPEEWFFSVSSVSTFCLLQLCYRPTLGDCANLPGSIWKALGGVYWCSQCFWCQRRLWHLRLNDPRLMGSPDREECYTPNATIAPCWEICKSVLPPSTPSPVSYTHPTTGCTLHMLLHFTVSNLAAPISLFRSEHNDFGLRLLNNLEKNRSNRIQSSE